MPVRAWRLIAALPLLAAAGGCAHAHYPYPPPGEGPYDEPPGWFEPAAWPRRIGVHVQPLTRDLREYFGVEGDAGLLVAAVEARSPASEAGLQAGDIILGADGRLLYEQNELVDALQQAPEGEPVELLILRKGHEQRLAVTPRSMEARAGPPPFQVPVPPPPGASDPELRERVRELETRVNELERELERQRRD